MKVYCNLLHMYWRERACNIICGPFLVHEPWQDSCKNHTWGATVVSCCITFLGFCHFPCLSFCYASCTEIFTFFACKKRKFYVMRHRTLEFKSQKIDRKVTESQKIKNKKTSLQKFRLFGSRELDFPSFTRSYLARNEKTSLPLDPKSPNFFASMLKVIFVFIALKERVLGISCKKNA